MRKLTSVALLAVAAALSSPVLAQDDPRQSAVNSDTSMPNSPFKYKGFPDAGEFNPTGRYVEARCDISRQKDAILGFKKRFMGSKGIVTVATHGLKKTASGRF